MIDKTLKKFMRSHSFLRLSKRDQMIELQDYKHQTNNFKPFKKEEQE